MKFYVAVCKDDKGNSVRIDAIKANSREEAEQIIKSSFNVKEIIAVLTYEDAEFIRKTLNGTEDDK